MHDTIEKRVATAPLPPLAKGQLVVARRQDEGAREDEKMTTKGRETMNDPTGTRRGKSEAMDRMIESCRVRVRNNALQDTARAWRVFARLADKHIAGSGAWRERGRGEVLPYVDMLYVERCAVFLSQLEVNSSGFTSVELDSWENEIRQATATCEQMIDELDVLLTIYEEDTIERREVAWLKRGADAAHQLFLTTLVGIAKAHGSVK